jgi:hypothetical protein
MRIPMLYCLLGVFVSSSFQSKMVALAWQ